MGGRRPADVRRPGARVRRSRPAVLALLAGALFTAPCTPSASDPEPFPTDPAQALRGALERAQRGETDAALDWLGLAAERFPLVADHADRLRVRLLLGAGRHAEAAERAAAAAQRHADSPLRPELLRALGDARAAQDMQEAAREAWQAALAEEGDDDVRATIGLAIAESYARSGDPQAAGDAFLRVWREHAASEAAERAAEALAAIESDAGASLREGGDWLAHADGLYAAHRSEAALAAYQRALVGSLPERARRRARERRARCLFNLRRYPEAVDAYAALGPDAESRFWHARSVARAGDVPSGVDLFERLGREQDGYHGARALYYAGLLLEEPEDAARAARNFRAVAARSTRLRPGALWALAWGALRAGERAEAATLLERLENAEDHPLDALRARYWRARASEPDDPVAARAQLAAIARDWPLSYYGWRARQRGAAPEAGHVPERVDPGRAQLDPEALTRARILIGAGLLEEARRELRALEKQAGGVEDRVALARLLNRAEAPADAVAVVERAYGEVLARGPAPGDTALWALAWPQPFPEQVSRGVPEAGRLEPALVWSIMREESRYRPDALSVVGARGLMQIMPETGEQLARERGLEPFDPDDLFLPGVNALLGAHYLEQLLGRFDGRLEPAIASYNAGPDAVARWLRERPDWASDEWVEAIPYSQTRHYVMRVLRSRHAYQTLYP